MKVKCVYRGNWVKMFKYVRKYWWSKKKKKKSTGPKYGDILTVESHYYVEGNMFYQFIEWPSLSNDDQRGFLATCFKPIDEEKAQFEEVTYSEIKKEVPVSAN